MRPIIALMAIFALSAASLANRQPDNGFEYDLPKIAWNDNLERAGQLRNGVLSVELEVRRGVWHVMGDDEPGGEVLAFAEAGKAPLIPGPMIRVPLGTEIHVTLTNPLDTTLVVYGLSSRHRETMDSIVVPAGESVETRFTADAEGTYFYSGAMEGSPTAMRAFEDKLLAGALIVDPAGTAEPEPDRVLVIDIWFDGKKENGEPDFFREFLVINGRPWPLTERFTYEMGDSVRWRLINASGATHPMHLHGFYFRVDARGDMARDTVYWPAQRRMAVTERMAGFTTMNIVWSADRPGGWIFHCHNSFHVVHNPSMREDRPSNDEIVRQEMLGEIHGDPHTHVVDAMGGLMLAMYVKPPEGWEPNEPRRRLFRIFVQSDSVPVDSPTVELELAEPERRSFAYVLQEGEHDPAPDSVRLPGSSIITWKGEPTSVMVINRTEEPTQVHWHGLEIESYFDGVAGVGGYPGRTTPAIMPGDSFEMRITPPRAGSFMYHTHVSDIRQQSAGLYAAFVVLDEGEEWDPEHDRILLVGFSPHEEGPHLNGSKTPDPMEFTVGETYRLRLMNITLFHGSMIARLLSGGAPARWRPIAHDGFDVPRHQRAMIPSEQMVSVGETYDFEFTPGRAGDYHLEFRSRGGRLFVDQLIRAVEPPATSTN